MLPVQLLDGESCLYFLLLNSNTNTHQLQRMKKKLSYICFVCLLFIPLITKAQTNLWLDYYQYRLLTNDKWKLSQRTSLQYNSLDDNVFTATYRPNYAHKVNQFGRVIVGNGFFYYHSKEESSNLELRPWIGFQRSPHRLARVGLTHYVRFENRVFIGNSDRVYEGRFRYKVSLVGDIYQKEGTALSLVLAPEMFVSVGTFDDFDYTRFRVTAGARYQWSPYWRTDLSVIKQTNKVDDPLLGDNVDWVIQLQIKRLLLRN